MTRSIVQRANRSGSTKPKLGHPDACHSAKSQATGQGWPLEVGMAVAVRERAVGLRLEKKRWTGIELSGIIQRMWVRKRGEELRMIQNSVTFVNAKHPPGSLWQ